MTEIGCIADDYTGGTDIAAAYDWLTSQGVQRFY
jgi:uncharacterized protein YgbK (DUF1537 family)